MCSTARQLRLLPIQASIHTRSGLATTRQLVQFNDRASMVVSDFEGQTRKKSEKHVFFPIYLDQRLDPGVVVQLSPVCHPRQTGHEHFLAAFGAKFWMSRRARLFGRIGCGEQIRAIRPVTQSLVEAHLSQHIDTLLKDLSNSIPFYLVTWTRKADGRRTAVISVITDLI